MLVLPVDYPLPQHGHEAAADLPQHVDRFGLAYASLLVHDLAQVAARAKLLHDVVVVGALHHVHEAHDVLRL